MLDGNKEPVFVNNVAMLRACKKSNYEMVLSFLSTGFYLNQEPNKEEEDLVKCFKIFSALSSSAYLVAKFHRNILRQPTYEYTDPISDAFLQVHLARKAEQL